MEREGKYIRVDKPTDRKMRFNGWCLKCNKYTDQRFSGSTWHEDFYRCIKCKTTNIEIK